MATKRQWPASVESANPLPVGEFALRRVVVRDVDLVSVWMNDPEVDRFWELAGPRQRTADHVAEQLSSMHSTAYLGLLDGVPMSYWELYWADLDPLAAHYPACPYDGGVHLLLGPSTCRGRGLGAILLTDVVDRVLTSGSQVSRLVAEPDVRNERSVRVFERAGFRRDREIDLPDKRAALMIKARVTR